MYKEKSNEYTLPPYLSGFFVCISLFMCLVQSAFLFYLLRFLFLFIDVLFVVKCVIYFHSIAIDEERLV